MSKISQKLRCQDWYRKRKWLKFGFKLKCCSTNSAQEEIPSAEDLSNLHSIPTLSLSHKVQYTNIRFCAFVLSLIIGFTSLVSMLVSPNANAEMPQKFSNYHMNGQTFSPTTQTENVENENFSSDSEISVTEEVSNIDSETFKNSSSEEANSSTVEQNSFGIPSVMYLHLEESADDPNFYWVPQILEQRISESDIAIDLSDFLDSNLSYELTDFERNLVNLIVHRESNGEPFIGQVLVAEDILNRFRSGIYGPDKIAILAWYGLETDDDGNYHVYNGSEEILEASKSVQDAVDLALKGSNISYFLLKATTDFQNERYGLELGDIYYKNGAMYHFSPRRLTDPKAIKTRTINKIPVSFWYQNHIFYGFWLPDSLALQIF